MLNEQQQEQFTQVWTEAQPLVNKYVASLVRDTWAEKDVMQNVSLALLRKFTDYDDSRPFLPWALGVAKFEVLSHRRDTARSRLIADSDSLDQYTALWAEVSTQLADEALTLRHCLKKLPDEQRTLVDLRYGEGLNSSEIGVRVSLKAAQVRKILKRSRDALRRCVERQLHPVGDTM